MINPFFWSMLVKWLSTFFSGSAHILLLQWPGQEWEESTSSSPEFSCSSCIISTACLVFPPTPPTWPISVYLKHDWQNTDNSPAPTRIFHVQDSLPRCFLYCFHFHFQVLKGFIHFSLKDLYHVHIVDFKVVFLCFCYVEIIQDLQWQDRGSRLLPWFLLIVFLYWHLGIWVFSKIIGLGTDCLACYCWVGVWFHGFYFLSWVLESVMALCCPFSWSA